MHVVLFTIGSAGDVYPFLGMALELKRRGHRSTLVANDYFRPLVEKAGVDFIGLGTREDFHAALRTPDLWSPKHGFGVLVRHAVLPRMRPTFEIANGFPLRDTILVASPLMLGARIAQERLGLPLASVVLQPSVIWSLEAPPALAAFPLPGRAPLWLKRLQMKAIDRFALDPLFLDTVNAFRGELGLNATRHIYTRWVMSPQKVLGLFPDWFAPLQSDWPAQMRLPGFVRLDRPSRDELPARLRDFLRAGEAPVVITPGTAMAHGEGFLREAVEAVQSLGLRAVLLTPHAEQVPKRLPDDMIQVDYAPFDSLFPKTSAVIHHGGIGTCAQALANGIPQLVVPQAFDQPDNGARLEALGVGETIPSRTAERGRIAASLARLLKDVDVRIACRRHSEHVDFDESRRLACDEIESLKA